MRELRGIEETDDGLRIGAIVTHTEVMESPLIASHAPAMVPTARTIGAVQTRNMGTIGGNLVTCVPSDLSILLVEQNLALATALGDRINIMAEHGKIVWQGSPAELEAASDSTHRHLGV